MVTPVEVPEKLEHSISNTTRCAAVRKKPVLAAASDSANKMFVVPVFTPVLIGVQTRSRIREFKIAGKLCGL